MGKELRETIKEITYRHLKKNNSQVFGQKLTGVGWVAGTLPKLYEKDGVIELPMADVVGGGIVTGSALMGKKPIYIIRYQGYNWLNCIFIVNYACKSNEIWKIPCPIFIRGIGMEGSIGPVAGSSHHSIYYRMPGIKIISPMTPNEYLLAYKNFMKDNDVYYISEHRGSYGNKKELPDYLQGNLDIIIFCISITRFEAKKVRENLPKNIDVTHASLFDNGIEGIKLKNKPIFSVQYHPESNPGPQDSVYLFKEFINEMKKNAKKKRY